MNEHLARYAFAARLARGKHVLDAGCGAGYGSAELAKTAAWVLGVDQSAEAAGFARENYRLPNLRFAQASVTALPHPDASFDLVVAFEVIEHLEDWREFLLRSAPRAGAHRPVHRLHAEQALLRGDAREGRSESVSSSRIRIRGIPRRALRGVSAHFAVSGESRGRRGFPARRGGRHGRGAVRRRRSRAGGLALLRRGVRAPAADRAIRLSSSCRAPATCCASGSSTSACSSTSWKSRTSGWKRPSRSWPISTRSTRSCWRCSARQKDELEARNQWAQKLNRELEERSARVGATAGGTGRPNKRLPAL